MANLPKFTLDKNERKDRWDLTNDKTNRTIKTFDTKADATKWCNADIHLERPWYRFANS